MSTIEATHFGTADEATRTRIISEMPPEFEQEAKARVATLASVSIGELANLLPGHGIVPDDQEGVARTYRQLGEAADFVMRHSPNPADRIGAAVVAAELQDTASAITVFGGEEARQGLQYDVFGFNPSEYDSKERQRFIAGIVDKYGLEPGGDGTATTAYIMSHARDWDLHASGRYEQT